MSFTVTIHYRLRATNHHDQKDRFGFDQTKENGKIDVNVCTDDEGMVESVSIRDNGKGFDFDNLNSFQTCDSTFKYTRGGKGVGRLIWIKTFNKIEIESVFEDSDGNKKLSFEFLPQSVDSISDRTFKATDAANPYTEIRLSDRKVTQTSRFQRVTFLKDLALHFLSLYVSGGLPDIDLTYNGESESLTDFIESKIISVHENNITPKIDEEKWSLNVKHLIVDNQISTQLRNSYVLTGHDRIVGDPTSVEKRYALKQLDDGTAYVAVFSGHPLDERVDQQRLRFRLNSAQDEQLKSAILEEIENYLSEHIVTVRAEQKKTVERVIFEHPQLAGPIGEVEDYVEGLYPGMDEEQIGENLFVLLYREEAKLRKKLDEIVDRGELSSKLERELKEITDKLSKQEQLRLAELLVKRHQILVAANLLVKFSNEEGKSYHYEKVVHDLIVPMRKMFLAGEWEKHNLWMLDDGLDAHQLVASDKPISSFTDESGDGAEPDVIFFNPLGFRTSNGSDPATIIEFKRPGDSRPSSDPVGQVLDYIDRLRGNNVVGLQGERITDITQETQFECFVVMELTSPARKLLERSPAQNAMRDGEGYYGFSRPHNAMIRVISFRKMLRDATLRHRAFFTALGLGDPGIMASREYALARAQLSEAPGD